MYTVSNPVFVQTTPDLYFIYRMLLYYLRISPVNTPEKETQFKF